jgi:hypothetical protein
MSDIVDEWVKATSHNAKRAGLEAGDTAIPSRKMILSYDHAPRSEYPDVIYAKAATRRIPVRTTRTAQTVPQGHFRSPRYLVIIFAAGLFVGALGILLLTLGFFVKIDGLNLASSLLLAVGATTVALALLRGQDLNERAK